MNFRTSALVFSVAASSPIFVFPYFRPITMTAPDTAPQILPVFEIPAPKPQAIFFAVSLSSPSSSENVEKTAEEQVNPFLKLARASSDFVMVFLLSGSILSQNCIKQVSCQREGHEQDSCKDYKQFDFNHLTAVSYTHLRAHETDSYLVCRLLLEK